MSKIRTVLRRWLPLAATLSMLTGLVYLLGQQSLRLGANAPQVQMAEDTAAALASGATPDSLLPDHQIDIATSLAPFLVIYDASGKPLAASGLLHAAMPLLPPGVFDAARQGTPDRVTWQPEPGVRVAAVVVAHGGASPGFVLAGRSLREVERLVDTIGQLSLLAWLVMLVVSLAVVSACDWLFAERNHNA